MPEHGHLSDHHRPHSAYVTRKGLGVTHQILQLDLKMDHLTWCCDPRLVNTYIEHDMFDKIRTLKKSTIQPGTVSL
jgi:hypothetical protein